MHFLEINLVHHQVEAWIWFIPIILGAAFGGGLLGALVGAILDVIFPAKGNTLAILGMQGAGKTQLLANLKNIDYKHYAATLGEEKYDKFKTTIGDREITIEGGIDIPGGNEFIKDYYSKLINENEIVFFVFNSYDYLNDNEYRLQTQARLDLIYELMKGKDKSTMMFGTFADKFANDDMRNDAYRRIKESVINKPYNSLFKSNYAILDMRNKKELTEKILIKIFQQ